MARAILAVWKTKKNDAKGELVMDVQGMMIGNGWIDPASQVWPPVARYGSRIGRALARADTPTQERPNVLPPALLYHGGMVPRKPYTVPPLFLLFFLVFVGAETLRFCRRGLAKPPAVWKRCRPRVCCNRYLRTYTYVCTISAVAAAGLFCIFGPPPPPIVGPWFMIVVVAPVRRE